MDLGTGERYRRGWKIMLGWYAAYAVGWIVAVVWYYSNLTFSDTCNPGDLFCDEEGDTFILKVAAIVGVIVLSLCLVLSWALLRMTVGWLRPAPLAGTLAALAGPALLVALTYTRLQLP
ncbi:hypothetical protein ACFO1B_20360 [Dactylosporangium siamense]|nr:hypothetical protein [Dactylosporangium siamense]